MTSYFVLTVVVLLGFSSTACNRHYWNKVVARQMSVPMRCPAHRIRVTQSVKTLGRAAAISISVAEGCGEKRTLLWNNDRERYEDINRGLLKRASFELDCPRRDLRVVSMGEWNLRGVKGCGKRGVYVFSISSQVWIMNTESKREGRRRR
jgi:hypothetical protein